MRKELSKPKINKIKEMIERGHKLNTIANDLNISLNDVIGVIKNESYGR